MTNKLLSYTIQNTIDDINLGDLYITIGNHQGVTSNTELYTDRELEFTKRNLIFGKKIRTDDYAFLIKKNQWVSGTVYSTYLENTGDDFYILNQNNDVYKCIWNNNNSPSTSEPISKTNELIETADSYIWKYMYSISSSDLNRFSSPTTIPIIANTDVQSNSTTGTIDFVRVNHGGSGYTIHNEGIIQQKISNTVYKISDSASETTNIYKNHSMYILSGVGSGTLHTISSSSANTSGKYVEFSSNTTLSTDSVYSITPSVNVYDRQGTGFLAYCEVENDIIKHINVINAGQNYINPTLTLNTTTGSGAEFIPFLSVEGGHGKNPITELKSNDVILTSSFLLNEDETLPNTNFSYYQVSLVYNPTVNIDGQNTISYGTSFNGNNTFEVNDLVKGYISGACGYVYWANTTHFKVNDILNTFSDTEIVFKVGTKKQSTATIIKQKDGHGGEILNYYNNTGGINRSLNTSEDLSFSFNLK